jgi:hypothetical protein
VKRKWVLVSLVAALIISVGFNVALSYLLMDRAMSMDDQSRGREWNRVTVTNLRWMADRYGRFPARGEVEAHMKVRFPGPDHVVKWDGDTLWVDEVGLHYVADSLASIVLMNEPTLASEVK